MVVEDAGQTTRPERDVRLRSVERERPPPKSQAKGASHCEGHTAKDCALAAREAKEIRLVIEERSLPYDLETATMGTPTSGAMTTAPLIQEAHLASRKCRR